MSAKEYASNIATYKDTYGGGYGHIYPEGHVIRFNRHILKHELGITGGKILDFGCGTGNQIIKIAQKWERSQITGIDNDESSIKIAKNEVKKLGLEDKVKIFNYEDYDKINNFDLIIMVEVFHEISEDKRIDCIKFCNDKLKDNGLLVILDETYPDTDEEFKMYEFQFPLQTSIEELFWGNFIPTRSSQESILKNAGFNKVINRKIVWEGFSLIYTKK